MKGQLWLCQKHPLLHITRPELNHFNFSFFLLPFFSLVFLLLFEICMYFQYYYHLLSLRLTKTHQKLLRFFNLKYMAFWKYIYSFMYWCIIPTSKRLFMPDSSLCSEFICHILHIMWLIISAYFIHRKITQSLGLLYFTFYNQTRINMETAKNCWVSTPARSLCPQSQSFFYFT